MLNSSVVYARRRRHASTMAPDQRAALELVLRQGRSYGELSDLLGHARGDDPHPRPRRRAGARPGPAGPGALGRDRRLAARPAVRGPRRTATARAAARDPRPDNWAATVAAACAMFDGRRARPDAARRRPTRPQRQVNGTAAGTEALPPSSPSPESSEAASAETPARALFAARRRAADRRGGRARASGVLAFVFCYATRRGDGPARHPNDCAAPRRRPRPRRRGLARRLVLKGPPGRRRWALMQLLRLHRRHGAVRAGRAGRGAEQVAARSTRSG